MTAARAGKDVPPPPDVDPPAAAGPSHLTRNELVYGLVIWAELITVAVMNVVIKGGKGAPTHPETSLAVVGVIVAALVGPVLIYFRSRTIAGFGAIIASLFVSLPKVPDRMSLTHAFALILPIAYALIITQRQRRALKQQIAAAGGRAPSVRRERGQGGRRGRRGRPEAAATVAPVRRATGRYTPPKVKRGRR